MSQTKITLSNIKRLHRLVKEFSDLTNHLTLFLIEINYSNEIHVAGSRKGKTKI